MSREFQSGLAEMAREAELDDIKRKVEGAARFDLGDELRKSVDPTGKLSSDFDPAEFNRQLKEFVEGGPPRVRQLVAALGESTGHRPARQRHATRQPCATSRRPSTTESGFFQARRRRSPPGRSPFRLVLPDRRTGIMASQPGRVCRLQIQIRSTHEMGKDEDIDASRMPLMDHLIELRRRLIWCIIGIVVLFFVCYWFAPHIYQFLVKPLANALHEKGGERRMIFTALHEAFFTYVKVAFFAAMFLVVPDHCNPIVEIRRTWTVQK